MRALVIISLISLTVAKPGGLYDAWATPAFSPTLVPTVPLVQPANVPQATPLLPAPIVEPLPVVQPGPAVHPVPSKPPVVQPIPTVNAVPLLKPIVRPANSYSTFQKVVPPIVQPVDQPVPFLPAVAQPVGNAAPGVPSIAQPVLPRYISPYGVGW